MKKTVLLMTLFCLLLGGCGQPAAPVESVSPEPAVPERTIPFEEGEYYAVAYLGYQQIDGLEGYYAQQYLLEGEELPTHYISGGDFYLIIPRYPDMELELSRYDIGVMAESLVYTSAESRPFLLQCNISDIIPDVILRLTYEGTTVEFSPFISLKDGSVVVGDHGRNITLAETGRE